MNTLPPRTAAAQLEWKGELVNVEDSFEAVAAGLDLKKQRRKDGPFPSIRLSCK